MDFGKSFEIVECPVTLSYVVKQVMCEPNTDYDNEVILHFLWKWLKLKGRTISG